MSWSETWAQISLMRGSVEAEDGGHGAFSGGDCLLHVHAAGSDGADGFGEGEGAGGDVGGVLAERVAGGEGGLDAFFGQDFRPLQDG